MVLATGKLVATADQVAAALEIDIQLPQADPALLVKEPMVGLGVPRADKTGLVQVVAVVEPVQQELLPAVDKQAQAVMDQQVQYLVLV